MSSRIGVGPSHWSSKKWAEYAICRVWVGNNYHCLNYAMVVMECLRGCIGNVQDASYVWMCGWKQNEMAVGKRKTPWSAGDLFCRSLVVNVPILLMKRLLAVCAIPASTRDRFYSVIPKLALLPPANLFGSELVGFENGSRVF